jgi:hypothetical protein
MECPPGMKERQGISRRSREIDDEGAPGRQSLPKRQAAELREQRQRIDWACRFFTPGSLPGTAGGKAARE